MEKKKQLVRALTLSLAIGAMFLLAKFSGLVGSGFESENVLLKYAFYLDGGPFAFWIIAAICISILITKDDKKLGNSVGFADQGEFPHVPIFKRFGTFQLAMLSLIFFSIIGMIVSIAQPLAEQRTFTGVATLKQEFTPGGSIIFNTFLVPVSENAAAAFFVALIFVLVRHIAHKYNWNKWTYIIILWLSIIIFMALFGVGNHIMRYQDSDVALQTVAGFWGLGAALTMITGSFVVFWMMHLANNLVYDLSIYMGSDMTTYYMFGIIVLLSVSYFFIYRHSLLGKKNTEKEMKI